MENQSLYDPTRKTVGAMSIEARETGEKGVIVGDIANELAKSLVDDLNDTIKSNPFDGSPFYICVHEKKDMQMNNAILRRMLVSLRRPYPEDDTVVFWVHPSSGCVRFCWSLPHHSDMDNAIQNFSQFHKDYIADIMAWKRFDLLHFGFIQVDEKTIIADPKHLDKLMVRRTGT